MIGGSTKGDWKAKGLLEDSKDMLYLLHNQGFVKKYFLACFSKWMFTNLAYVIAYSSNSSPAEAN